MTMYTIHTDFPQFLDAVPAVDGARVVYMQDVSPLVEKTMRVIASGLYLTAAGDTVHAAHLRVERTSLYGAEPQEDRHAAIMQRLQTARDLVVAALHDRGITARSGMIAVPGLMDDIKRFDCHHDLWQVVVDGDSRTLVCGPAQRAA
jgi:hypothetical protein